MRVSLSPDEAAASAYRVFHESCLRSHYPAFDDAPFEEQVKWFRLARFAEKTLEEFHGKSYESAASALAAVHAGGDSPAEEYFSQRRVQVAWQAVCRHLTTLLDCDDVFDLELLEQSWREWSKGRHGLEGVIS